MEQFEHILGKLESFILKYYKNKLLKGIFLFIAAGLLYFLLSAAIEYVFWLNTRGRLVLFWSFVGVEIFLFIFFIVLPLAKIFKFSKSISQEQASVLIGAHFPEVKDKLQNLLQLRASKKQSDLLLASINQKSYELKAIPFNSAITYKKSLTYLKYAAFPVILIVALWAAGYARVYTNGFERMHNYDKSYVKPAPFQFMLYNDSLKVEEGKDFLLKVGTKGTRAPAEIAINFDDNRYFLKKTANGKFEFPFLNLSENVQFRLSANGVRSRQFVITSLKVPKLLNFEARLHYPPYLRREDQTFKGTGNFTVPEGSKLTWKFNTENTNLLNFRILDSVLPVKSEKNEFVFSKSVFSSFTYSISTSNSNFTNFQPLEYKIKVIKDEFPEINVEEKEDSTQNAKYYRGRISDDYGLTALRLVYFSSKDQENKKTVDIAIENALVDEFLFTFPGALSLQPGTSYSYYFQVIDNDNLHDGKSRNSEIFNFRKASAEEKLEQNLQQQKESLNGMNEIIEESKSSQQDFQDLFQMEKETDKLDYDQQQKLNTFLQRQQQQNKMMQNYADKLKKNMEKFQDASKKDSLAKKQLTQRIEKNEKQLKENEKLLKELEELGNKLDQDALGKKIEKLGKQKKTQERSLEQLLELTKKYYVNQKAKKLAKDLNNLAEAQEKLANLNTENSVSKQDSLSTTFHKIQQALSELEDDNKNLKNPTGLPRDKVSEESIKKSQKNASEHLQKKKFEQAKKEQKNAAKEIKKMARKIQQKMASQSAEQLQADIGSLRAVLDNLVIFSFKEEDLMDNFKSIEDNSPQYASKLREQSELRENFRHIDDSLYSLALKNPLIGEEVTHNLSEVEFNIEKALERLSENEISQGAASQQYVVTGANNLAYLLDNILSSLQQQANPQMGQGGGNSEFQLPDIMAKQSKLNEEMGEALKEKENGEKGSKEGEPEEMSGELFEIYKKQQQLRKNFEEMKDAMGNSANAESLKEDMQSLEEKLLDKGITMENLQLMHKLEQQLLKLNSAKREQGTGYNRTSKTNTENFENSPDPKNEHAKEYFNSTEILNRQAVPLQQNYQLKVKRYFEGRNN